MCVGKRDGISKRLIRGCLVFPNFLDLPSCSSCEHQLAYVSDSGHHSRVKPVDFHPKALDFIRAQPASIRQQIGERLQEVLDETTES